MLEHKGLYWSKIKGTEDSKTIEPDEDYIIPLGKARTVITADASTSQNTCAVITYGMGVYWAAQAAKQFNNQLEIIDLRTLYPLDTEAIYAAVRKHGRAVVLTEEPVNNGFAQSIAAGISKHCFEQLDAPVEVIGSKNMPAIPLNSALEAAMLPNADKVTEKIKMLLGY
jgi:2-oxoisovalerate dehydrogenase E1 component